MPTSRKTTRSHVPRILGIGGAHIDRRGRLAGLFVPGASNPGRMREEVGGVVFNALRCASQCGAAASLISLRGGDPAGERIAATIEAAVWEGQKSGLQALGVARRVLATAGGRALGS